MRLAERSVFTRSLTSDVVIGRTLRVFGSTSIALIVRRSDSVRQSNRRKELLRVEGYDLHFLSKGSGVRSDGE